MKSLADFANRWFGNVIHATLNLLWQKADQCSAIGKPVFRTGRAMDFIPRRRFLALASAAAFTPVLPIRQAGAVEPVIAFKTLLSLFFIIRGLYENYVVKPQERQSLLRINNDLVAVGELSKRILDELEGMGITVRKELEEQFKVRDITEVAALERKFSDIQAVNVSAGLDPEDIQMLARRANVVASRLGQYADYAAFPAFLRAAWLQVYFASLNGFTPLQLREIIRQQQRACAGWADIAMTASVNIEAVKQSDGFLVRRHYDFTSAADGSRQRLTAGSVILGIDDSETKDMSGETFARLLSGAPATKVSLLVKPPAGDIYNFVAAREFTVQGLPEYEKRTLLESDIVKSILELQGRTKDLENRAGARFVVAEHVGWTKTAHSFGFSSTRINATMKIDIDNGSVEVVLQEGEIPGMCPTTAVSSTKCTADKKYRAASRDNGNVSYFPVSEVSAKAGCSKFPQERTEYSIDIVKKYSDATKACVETYFANAQKERQGVIDKIGRMMEIKMGAVLMVQHLRALDARLQHLADLGYGAVPYVACGNASGGGAGSAQCISQSAVMDRRR